jgi:hypothetical protein
MLNETWAWKELCNDLRLRIRCSEDSCEYHNELTGFIGGG